MRYRRLAESGTRGPQCPAGATIATHGQEGASTRQEDLMDRNQENNGSEFLENLAPSMDPAPMRIPGETGSKKSFPRLSPAEHLDEAINALADGYYVDRNPTRTVWGRIGDAKRHLDAIEPGTIQYAPARHLLREALSRQKQMENVSMHVTNQIIVRQREMMAHELEQYYLTRGILVDVELGGPEKTAIKLTGSAFCDATIDRIVDGSNFFDHLKQAGFKRVVLGDNDESVWSYNLKNS
jgi:hypothetical protein